MEEELPPSPHLVESMRSIGYSVETAVADIIDNSLAANASAIEIEVSGLPDAFITVLDDGWGMSKAALREAMEFAGRPPSAKRLETDLGRFGLGLKTASLSQARKLTVLSKEEGGPEVVACWNLDLISQRGKWVLLWPENIEFEGEILERFRSQKSGTLVIWQELDQVSNSLENFDSELRVQASQILDHISLVFHRFLDGTPGSKISIKLNGEELDPIDPFFRRFQATQKKPTTKIELRNGTVSVTPFIIPHISQLSKSDAKELMRMRDRFRDSQGFYVYRAGRLITFGSWFRLAPKTEISKMARVQVDTPTSLDKEWQIGVMKSSVIPPAELRKHLANLVPTIVGESKRVVLRRGASPQTNSIWSFRELGPRLFKLEISREHPLLKSLSSELEPEQLRALGAFVDQVERSVPQSELLSRLASDSASESSDLGDHEMREMALVLGKVLWPTVQDVARVLEIISTSEPFASDPLARERLSTWTEELKIEWTSN